MKGMNPSTDAKQISRANGCRRAVEAPRGHAKSTNFTFKDSIHSAVYAYKHYEIILSDSSEQAEGFLSDIKTELEENAALREDFGELEGRVWKASVILLSNGVKIEALGAGKKIRGRRHKQWRPDLILCDDLENDENVNTPEQRKKLRDWFYKAVSKAGDTYTDIVYIGTLLHYDALLANVAKNPEYEAVRYKGVISFATNTALWDAWERIFTDLENPKHKEDAEDFFKANEAEMLEGTAVLWEEKLPYYALMVMRVSEGEASFSSEIQNEPIDPENCAFAEERRTPRRATCTSSSLTSPNGSRTRLLRTRSRRLVGSSVNTRSPSTSSASRRFSSNIILPRSCGRSPPRSASTFLSRRSTASRTRTPASSPCSPSSRTATSSSRSGTRHSSTRCSSTLWGRMTTPPTPCKWPSPWLSRSRSGVDRITNQF